MENEKRIPDCPVEMTLQLIGDKWKVLILRDLMTGTRRFNELMRSVGGITQKVLTSHLRAMERDGLLTRKIYPEVPPKVEYTLTETGYSLKPILDSMSAWGEDIKANAHRTCLKFIRRIAGEIGNHAVWILQAEYLEHRIVRRVVLSLYNRIRHTCFFYRHIIFKHSPAVQAEPGEIGISNTHLNLRILLHVLIYILLVVCTEPHLPILLTTKHKRTAFCLSISSYGCQILHRVCL